MAWSEAPVVVRMQALVDQWEAASDRRAVFLSCYRLMTGNMLAALDRREFQDPAWVDRLLHRFADYYFVALDAYERDPASAPRVWQLAHNLARDPGTLAFQQLLLGVNAHINYDLVLTLRDMLEPEWAGLSADGRAARYADHCLVNDVIGRTIDAVQDQVLEPAMPLMDLVDKLLGPVDELLISGLIARWRETVWRNATRLVETPAPGQQAALLRRVEAHALRLGERIALDGAAAPPAVFGDNW